MFSPTEDLSRAPRKWRTALRNAAELVVAFATLDSYPLSRAPHDSPAGADAHPATEPADPHGRHARALPSQRRRGHGAPVQRTQPCLLAHRAAPTAPRTLTAARPGLSHQR